MKSGPFILALSVLNILFLINRILFPCFLHHYCLQILYTTNFLIQNDSICYVPYVEQNTIKTSHLNYRFSRVYDSEH